MRKYSVGLNVHTVSFAIAMVDAHGKLVTRTMIETTTETYKKFLPEPAGRDSQQSAADAQLASFSCETCV